MTSTDSWQAHADAFLANKNLDHYGLYGQNGGPWAVDQMVGFDTNLEMAHFVSKIVKGEAKSYFESGPKLNGHKYFATTADEESLIAKSGELSLLAYMTKQCVIVVTCSDSKVKSNVALPMVLKFKEYLEKMGF